MNALEQGRILVTGGAGFIGSALIWALNERGYDNILVSDILGTGDKYRNLVPLRFRDYIEADDLLHRLQQTPAAFGDLGCILHLGANSSTTENNCTHLIRNNYEYTKALAHWALEHEARFVYASSAATYGDGSQGMEDSSCARLHSLRPLNMYGYSKHLFDLYARAHGLLDRIVGLKYFNVFGPNEDHKGDMRSLVHKAFQQIRETGKVQLFKSHRPDFQDGEQQRDFLYVKDAVNMTLHLTASPKASGLFNIGTGQAHTWNALAKAIFDALSLPPQIEYIDMPLPLREKYQYFTQANISRLRSLGYDQAPTPLHDAIADYVRHYLLTGKRLGD